MNSIFSQKLSDDAEIRRIEVLFDSLPSSIVVSLIGVFLCFLVLFDTAGMEPLKLWVAYMLSVLAVRAWFRYMFTKCDRQIAGIHRWEWLFAFGTFLTGIGWGVLFGPLYPPPTHPDAQMFVALMVVITAFTGSVFVALSNITFWLFIIPTLSPAIFHYAATLGEQAQWPITAAACCIAVFIIVQRTLYRSSTDSLQRSTEAEILLAEQQAIFDSSPMGIAVIRGKQVIKSNLRFGELLGRRIQDLTASRVDHHFVSKDEADRFLADTAAAFEKGHLAQGMYRLRRADGTQFWAELSGRTMAGGTGHSVWMIADVTLRVANERRSHKRD
ncbi:PAS domain S-box protein [Sulfuritalea sp.]|uniref:PAS domain S-box protein n=1 Tax=Sulfuritalea sp. TaxID=2480090 RepID=UPI00286E348C|nr:PAS domain S-box protein [Sulfuritalea sp.]